MREAYRLKYGVVTMFEDIRLLRNYLLKILRKTFRRIQRIIKVEGNRLPKDIIEIIKF